MNSTRRTFLQQGLGCIALQCVHQQRGGIASALLPAVTATPNSQQHTSISTCFGISDSGQLLDTLSYYRVPAAETSEDRLCFDISNNRIACSLNTRGLLERFAIQTGVEPVETRATPVGAYMDKVLCRYGPWPISVRIDDAEPVRLDHLPQPEVHLYDNLLPRFTWVADTVTISLLAFAPRSVAEAPRAICGIVNLSLSSESRSKKVCLSVEQRSSSLPEEEASAMPAPSAGILDGTADNWAKPPAESIFDLQAGKTVDFAFAFLIAADPQELAATCNQVKGRSAQQWLTETLAYHRSRYGRLTIPEAPFFAELQVRAAELTRQSLLLNTDGSFGGSFNGSDLPEASNIWMRDCFYSSLPQSLFSPELCAKAILFLLDHSIPTHVLGEHIDRLDRFPGAAAVTNSLGNSVSGIVLAGSYYASTGDREFFLSHPEVLSRSAEILDAVLASRREDVFLFPSFYVSDGEARGDYHTGSNISVWCAFRSLARLADEVYRRPDLAIVWRAYADRLHQAILDNCVVQEKEGPRFVEGAMQDHTKIMGHDGEESDVTLAPFYGFCEADDERYLNAARMAVSPPNPYLIPELEGIWWYAHGRWSSATFPGWITALAASFTEEELQHHLERIRTLTDADGSFWWWPYRHDSNLDSRHPLRGSSKCGWAAGTYTCFFLRHVLGLLVDVPSRRLAFRPFTPWREFRWEQCRIGSVEFDCGFLHKDGTCRMHIRNRWKEPLEVMLEMILPNQIDEEEVNISGGKHTTSWAGLRYHHPSRIVMSTLVPGEEIQFWISSVVGTDVSCNQRSSRLSSRRAG